MDKYVIIIGAMKSGTTTLYEMLAQHPKIAKIHPKEPGYYAFDTIHAQGLDWYHGLFQFDPAQHIYRMEASTDYTKAPFVDGVAERMSRQPDATFKLIYIMRNPLKRIESHARHVQRTNREVGRIDTVRDTHSLDNGVSLPSLAMTRYAMQLDQFKTAYESGDLHLTTLEELSNETDHALDAIWRFLELTPPPKRVEAAQHNAAGTTQKIHPLWGYVAHNEAVTRLGKAVLPWSMRSAIRSKFKVTSAKPGRFTLDQSERDALIDILRPDLIRLRDVYGVDVERLWSVRL